MCNNYWTLASEMFLQTPGAEKVYEFNTALPRVSISPGQMLFWYCWLFPVLTNLPALITFQRMIAVMTALDNFMEMHTILHLPKFRMHPQSIPSTTELLIQNKIIRTWKDSNLEESSFINLILYMTNIGTSFQNGNIIFLQNCGTFNWFFFF